MINTILYWRTYFDGNVPPGSEGATIVLKNTCGQQYTYRVEDDLSVQFIGHGDLHDTEYTYLGVENPIEYLGAESQDPRSCYYTIHAYPSEEFHDRYITTKPGVSAAILAALFIFTSIVFVFYDYSVERRQKIVMKSAEQSGKLVSTLYPKEVREQLYQEQEDANHSNSKQAFVHTDGTIQPKAAIATCYENCTVFFGDLVGFTKWSSTRTPAEVFQLLESIYGALDKVAERRSVFKVETVGDVSNNTYIPGVIIVSSVVIEQYITLTISLYIPIVLCCSDGIAPCPERPCRKDVPICSGLYLQTAKRMC